VVGLEGNLVLAVTLLNLFVLKESSAHVKFTW